MKQIFFDEKQLDALIIKINNSKSFWSRLKSLTTRRREVENNITTEEWMNHFDKLLNPETEDINEENRELIDIDFDDPVDDIEDFLFNTDISEDEIRIALKHFRKGKKPGPDCILPEFFIYGIDSFIHVLVKLFNRLFVTKEYPASWCESLIVVLHKKGDVNSTDNYRGISLQNVLSKLYCSVLVARLNFFAYMYQKISESQSGFKVGYSTVDNAFVLRSIIERYIHRKRGKLYVAFVDFQKCFDTIDRSLLWQTLRNSGVKGRLFYALQSMYTSVKACIRCNNERSQYMNCTIGLKQGCLASPILFSFFIDELEHVMNNSEITGIQLHPDITQIMLLMFADDLALLSDTIVGLQRQLNVLSDFCTTNKLKVNEAKTKVLVFKSGGILSRHESWTYNNVKLEVVNKLCYVGVTFTRQLSFPTMVQELCIKGKRIIISILSSLYKSGQLPKTIFFKIFDTKICPQLLYGAEVWGLEEYIDLERVQYHACKRFMCVKQNTCNAAVLGDCYRFPLFIETYKRCIRYWFKILNMTSERYVKKCYLMMVNDDINGKTNWVTKLKHILQRNGFGNVWENQGVGNELYFIKIFIQRLKDQHLQDWNQTVTSSSKLSTYVKFKHCFVYERYLDVLNIRKFRYIYASFRSSSHDLEIERGRYHNIERSQRICRLCDENVVEDEFHFLLCCDLYHDLREMYIPYKYFNNSNQHKFAILMATQNEILIKSVATYLHYAFKRRRTVISLNT
jgi:hypothetical protein